MNGSDDQENLVLLTAREHYIAHWLLVKIARDEKESIKLRYAFSAFLYNQTKRNFTSRQYKIIKEHLAIVQSNREISEETRQKMRESIKNRPPISEETKQKMVEVSKNRILSEEFKNNLRTMNINRKHTEKAKQNMKLAQQNRPPISEETRQKMRESAKNRKVKVKQSEATIQRMKEVKANISEETRKKMSIAAKNRIKKNGAGTGNSGQFTRADQTPEEEK